MRSSTDFKANPTITLFYVHDKERKLFCLWQLIESRNNLLLIYQSVKSRQEITH